MRINPAFASLLIIAIAYSCETPSGGITDKGVVYHAEVTDIEIPDTITVADTLRVGFRVTTPCINYKYSHVELTRYPNGIHVWVYGLKYHICYTALGSFFVEIEEYPIDPGIFTVGVIQPDKSKWEETVVILAGVDSNIQ